MHSLRGWKDPGSRRSVLKGARGIGWALFFAALLAVSLAACGGGGSSSTSTSSTSTATKGEGGSAVVQAAQAEVDKFTAEHTAIEIPPVGKPIPSDKTIAILTCPLPICTTVTNATEAAAKELGWNAKVVPQDNTPEGYVSGWNAVLQAKPDGVAYIGSFPNSFVKQQLAQLEQEGIPAVVFAPSGPHEVSGPVIQALAGYPNMQLSGELMGDAVVADSGATPPKTALLYDKTFNAVFGPVNEAFTDKVTEAGGSVENIEATIQEIGKGIPGQVVSFLQAHPDVRYVATNINDFLAGVPQALQAAGLAEKVKLVARGPQATNMKELESGALFASVAEENESNGWRAIDAIARTFVGDANFEAEPVGWHYLVTEGNAASTKVGPEGTPATPGSPEAFLEAWGMSGK